MTGRSGMRSVAAILSKFSFDSIGKSSMSMLRFLTDCKLLDAKLLVFQAKCCLFFLVLGGGG